MPLPDAHHGPRVPHRSPPVNVLEAHGSGLRGGSGLLSYCRGLKPYLGHTLFVFLGASMVSFEKKMFQQQQGLDITLLHLASDKFQVQD